MLQVGIFTGYFPYPLEETAKKITRPRLQHGAARPALQGHRLLDARNRSRSRRPSGCARPSATTTCRSAASRATPTSSTPTRRSGGGGSDLLKATIRNARHFGSPYVISETGTFNTELDWVHHPKNKTEEGFADCREVIRELAQLAYDHGAVFLLETYVNNVVGSVEETVRMFAEVDHPGLGLLMDPTNYFEDHNIDKMDAVLKQIFDTLSDRVRISHAKDVKRAEADTSEKHADIGDEDALESHTFRGVGAIELPAPGLGSLELRPLPAAAGGEAPQHPDHHRASGGGRRAAREEVPRRPAARERALGRWWRSTARS